MRISLIQSALTWESPDANRQHFEKVLTPLLGKTDLVVLPEMFTTGFSMNAETLGEPMNGITVAWMRGQAHRLGAAVAGSFICREGDRYYNRFIFMRPDFRHICYDKRHLFSLAGEDRHFTPGHEQVIVSWGGFRIRLMVCYDLRFPVWSRGADADLLLYVANWPERRGLHWRTLLQARAIENQAYVAGVNIVGTDGNGLDYAGDSQIIDPSGRILAQLSYCESVVSADLSLEQLQAYRQQLPFLSDSDHFQLNL
jgi:omega-amidase